ncbi:MAG: polysulfide reductase NrfD [Acidimicrobiia bacterium]|nr:polysulfide reductase NrfD [Acidimicrobiia bacterium]
MTAGAPAHEADGLAIAAFQPTTRLGWRFRLTAGLLGVVVLAGVGAFVVQLTTGIGVTGLNNGVFWGLYTVDLVTFIGLSYGGALVSAILRLTHAEWRGPITRIAEGTALVTLAIGSLFPIIHIGHPERAWTIITRFQINSPIAWDMVAISTYLLATVVFFWLPIIPDAGKFPDDIAMTKRQRGFLSWASAGWVGAPQQQRLLARSQTMLAVLIIPLAVMVHTVLSYAFSLTSRPGWHSTIFGPYFVVAAIYSGVALVILTASIYRRAYRLQHWITTKALINLGYVMVALAVGYAYLLFTEVTTEGYVGEESTETLLFSLLLDRWAGPFWTFVVLGLAVPVLLVAIPKTRTVGGVTIAAGMVVAAMFLKRYLMFIPPLTRPLIGGEVATYWPSWVEWTVTAGAVAAVPLCLMALFRFVPVLSVHEMLELGAVEIEEDI